ncbi:DUF805 domain-containing protein [Pseudoroseicyclus sp. H15]
MTFGQAITHNFRNYVTFSGRAPRSEFWWWVLFSILAGIVLGWLDVALFGESASYVGDGGRGYAVWSRITPFTSLFGLITLLPSISVTVRRLHDTDRSGWWWWLWLIPLIGAIILLVWLAGRGTRGPNAYGDDPLGREPYGGSSVPNTRR